MWTPRGERAAFDSGWPLTRAGSSQSTAPDELQAPPVGIAPNALASPGVAVELSAPEVRDERAHAEADREVGRVSRGRAAQPAPQEIPATGRGHRGKASY